MIKKIMRKISISIKMVTKNGKIYDDENNENVREVADDQPSWSYGIYENVKADDQPSWSYGIYENVNEVADDQPSWSYGIYENVK